MARHRSHAFKLEISDQLSGGDHQNGVTLKAVSRRGIPL